jgi:hypothetical protein
MQFAGATSGPILREIQEVGSVEANPLALQPVNLILRMRCRMAGSTPQTSALTDCDLALEPKPDGMEYRCWTTR